MAEKSNDPGSLEGSGSSFKFDLSKVIPDCEKKDHCTDVSCNKLHEFKYCQEYMNGTPWKCPKKEQCTFLRVSRAERALYLTTGTRTDRFKAEVVRTVQIGGACRDFARLGICSAQEKYGRKCRYSHLSAYQGNIVDSDSKYLIHCPICKENIPKWKLGVFMPCQHAVCMGCGLRIYEENLYRDGGHQMLFWVWNEQERVCPLCKQRFDSVERIA